MTQLQLDFTLAPPPSRPPDLVARLRVLGMAPSRPVTLHRNRRTMISVGRGGAVRIHSGYAWASDEVVSALVTWAAPRVRSDVRREAARVFLSFPVHQFVAPPVFKRRPESEPGDTACLARLQEAHASLNRQWFGSRLRPITIRLSRKMKRKLGHYEPSSHGTPSISMGRRHLRRDPWHDVLETLLHEMVHQWQDETGRPVNHGAQFRRKAAEVGIEPRAVRRKG